MAGRTSARAVSRYGRLRDRQSGVRAMLLDRDDEIRSEETQRRLEIDGGDGGFGGLPGVPALWQRSACPRAGRGGRLAGPELPGTPGTERPRRRRARKG